MLPSAGRPPSTPQRNIFMLSVRSSVACRVHGLAFAGASQMGESSAGNQAARGLVWMIDGG